jgi:nitroreductase
LITRPVLTRLVELACLAPSVHNTQPWRWRADRAVIRLYADRSRLLVEEDPRGRNLVISCGAALDHLLFAGRALGLTADVSRLPHGPDDDLLAEVTWGQGDPSPTPAADIALLRTRCTDRRRFTSWPVPPQAAEQLAVRARVHGNGAVAVTDPATRLRLELLTSRAYLQHVTNGAALAEQQAWVGRSGTDGVPLAVLPAAFGPAAARFVSGPVQETRRLLEDGDAVLAIGGSTDDPAAWLATGEGLSDLWLQATRDGLSVVPMSLPVEIGPIREELTRTVLGGAFSPHLLLRVGWQAIGRSELPRTPRRPVDDVLRD